MTVSGDKTVGAEGQPKPCGWRSKSIGSVTELRVGHHAASRGGVDGSVVVSSGSRRSGRDHRLPAHEIPDNAFQKSSEKSFSRKRESQSGGRDHGRTWSSKWIQRWLWRRWRRQCSSHGSGGSRRVHDRYSGGSWWSQRQLWREQWRGRGGRGVTTLLIDASRLEAVGGGAVRELSGVAVRDGSGSFQVSTRVSGRNRSVARVTAAEPPVESA